jgi:hypothetical protein
VYFPPSLPAQTHHSFNEYLYITTTDMLCNEYPNSGLLFLGDFNNFSISKLLTSHGLKRIVQGPTRGSAILDLIITNLSNYYGTSEILAPLGSADYSIVTWTPCASNPTQNQSAKVTKRLMRCYPHSSINAFGRWASIPCHEWFQALNSNCTPDELASSFTLDLVEAMNRIFPLKTVKIHPSDKPWITSTIKNLIKTRQKAFHDGNLRLWRNLRNKVQHAISMRKKSFYNTKARQLKKNDNRKWWTIIN